LLESENVSHAVTYFTINFHSNPFYKITMQKSHKDIKIAKSSANKKIGSSENKKHWPKISFKLR
jgi:hypothetical protein